MDGIHDHLMGDYDYELGPGADGEFDDMQRRRQGRTPSAYRRVETPDLPVIDGNFLVLGTPRLDRRTVGAEEVHVLNFVIAAEAHQRYRGDGRVETIESPPLAVAVWGDDGTHLARHLTEGSLVSARGFLRVAAYRRTPSDPAIEVYQPKVLIIAKRSGHDGRPRSSPTPAPAAPRALDGYFDDDEVRDDDLPARATGETDSEWIGRCARAGWSYDRENDNPFAGGPTADGFSRDRWAEYR